MLWGFSVRNLGMKPTVCKLQTIYEEILQHASTASVTSIMYLTMWLFFFFPGVQHCADIPSVSTFQSSYSGWVKCKATSMSLNSFLPMLIFFTEMTPVIALSKVPKKKKKYRWVQKSIPVPGYRNPTLVTKFRNRNDTEMMNWRNKTTTAAQE